MLNIYLTGMMGSGKSVTGWRLASRLGYIFVDLDELIQTRTKKMINEIFASEGEEAFRHQESLVVREVAGETSRVIATGGGTVLKSVNVDLMHQSGKIVFLETSPDMLWERVKGKKDRPLLRGDNPKGNLMRIYADRQPLYENTKDFKVTTDGKTAAAVADEIFQLLKEKL